MFQRNASKFRATLLFLLVNVIRGKSKVALNEKSLKVFRLKAAILGLQFVKLMMFNCGNPREPKGTQGNPREPKGTQGNPREPKGTQGNPREPKGTQGNPREPKGTQGNSRELKGTQGNSREPKGTQGNLSWCPLSEVLFKKLRLFK